MDGLDHHYGSDASLDADTVRRLNAFLQAHAGQGKRAAEEPPQDRITRSAWFERKHRGVEPAVWKLQSVNSAASAPRVTAMPTSAASTTTRCACPTA